MLLITFSFFFRFQTNSVNENFAHRQEIQNDRTKNSDFLDHRFLIFQPKTLGFFCLPFSLIYSFPNNPENIQKTSLTPPSVKNCVFLRLDFFSCFFFSFFCEFFSRRKRKKKTFFKNFFQNFFCNFLKTFLLSYFFTNEKKVKKVRILRSPSRIPPNFKIVFLLRNFLRKIHRKL